MEIVKHDPEYLKNICLCSLNYNNEFELLFSKYCSKITLNIIFKNYNLIIKVPCQLNQKVSRESWLTVVFQKIGCKVRDAEIIAIELVLVVVVSCFANKAKQSMSLVSHTKKKKQTKNVLFQK